MASELPDKEGALVTTDDMTNIEIWMPPPEDRSAEMPPVMAFLTACCMRFHHDPTFVQEQLDWLTDQCNNLPKELPN